MNRIGERGQPCLIPEAAAKEEGGMRWLCYRYRLRLVIEPLLDFDVGEAEGILVPLYGGPGIQHLKRPP